MFGAQEEGFDPTDKRHFRKSKKPMYTKFDGDGVPTHDWAGEKLGADDAAALRKTMEEAVRNAAAGIPVGTGGRKKMAGEVDIVNPSLIFRGLTVVKKD